MSTAQQTPLSTDIVLPIYPIHAGNIEKGIKNHEFRKYIIPGEVCRFWLYEQDPVLAVRLIATVGPAKIPGQVCDPTGLRNDEFDSLDPALNQKYAYEILKLERLEQPITRERLESEGWWNPGEGKYWFVMDAMAKAADETQRTLVYDRKATAP